MSATHTEERFLQVPVEAVFEGFLEPRTLGRWAGVRLAVVERVPGGLYRLETDGVLVEGRFTGLFPPESFEIAGDGFRLSLHLDPGLGGTRAHLERQGGDLFRDALARLDALLSRPER